MAVALLMGMQAEAKKVKLAYHLKAGDKFTFEVTTHQDMTQEMMGQSQSIATEAITTYGFTVTDVTPEGNIKMDVALVAYAMASSSPMGEIKYNSVTDSVVPDYAKAMTLTLNEVYRVTLSPLGHILDVTAPDGIVEKVTRAMEASSGGMSDMASVSASKAASAEGFKKIVEGMFIQFPEDGVQLNTPWIVKSTIEQMIRFVTNSRYELAKSSKEGNEIKVTTALSQDPDAPPVEIQGMNMHYELVGSRDGTLVLDPETGLLKSGAGVLAVSGTISLESPQLPSPMSIPMTIKVNDKTARK
jgi:hypothetical protein